MHCEDITLAVTQRPPCCRAALAAQVVTNKPNTGLREAASTSQSSSNFHLAEPEQTTLQCSGEWNLSLSQHDNRLQHPAALLSLTLGEVFLTGSFSLFQ